MHSTQRYTNQKNKIHACTGGQTSLAFTMSTLALFQVKHMSLRSVNPQPPTDVNCTNRRAGVDSAMSVGCSPAIIAIATHLGDGLIMPWGELSPFGIGWLHWRTYQGTAALGRHRTSQFVTLLSMWRIICAWNAGASQTNAYEDVHFCSSPKGYIT